MNQKVIEVELKAPDDEKDILVFNLEDDAVSVNLNNDNCQADLKRVFVKLLNQLCKEDFILEFKHGQDYNRAMYIEICEEYINDLNRELERTKEFFDAELIR